MNQWIRIGLGFTFAFLILWVGMLMRGYDYFIAWKDVMTAIIVFLWVVCGFGYVVFDAKIRLRECRETK